MPFETRETQHMIEVVHNGACQNPVAPTATETQTIRRMRRSPHLSQDEMFVFFSSFQVDMDVGVGLPSNADPQMALRWSDDGGETWSPEKWVSVGMIGRFHQRALWRRLGRGRDRVFEVTMSDPVKWALVDAIVKLRVGIS